MNALELRRRTLGKGVYKKTVEGNPAIAQGSLARRYPGITMQGWTEQDSTEGKNLFDGIFTVDTVLDTNGETVPYSGRSTTDFIKVKQSTDYTGFTRYLRACYYDAGKVIISYDDDTVTRQTPEGCEYVRFCFINGSNVMFNEGSTVLPYEPYTGGQPSPNPDYPQEIVSAGKYDEGTGKYQYTIKISDSEESPTKSQTVTLTADRPLTKWDRLEKRNGQWGWVYKSAEINITDESPLQKYGADKISLYVSDAYLFGIPYCEKYVCQNGVPATENRIGLSSGSHAFVIYDTRYLDNVESYKQWLSENPLTLWYETTEETFVPLSETEQEQMNELYTFRPTTVLSNDCDCNMSLTYKTKKSMQSAPGGGIRKSSGVTSYFTFGVKWNQINKIVLKISGVTQGKNILLCAKDKRQLYIALDSNESYEDYKHPSLNGFTADVTPKEFRDGEYHEVTFTFDTPICNIEPINVWDREWSKNIIYHEIAFYNGDELLADYVPYYKSAGYMLDKKNNVVIRATNPDDYEFA